MRPIVLINALAAGAYRSGSSVADIIGRTYAGFGIAAEVRSVSQDGFGAALREARSLERPLVVAGGDGSVSAAVQLLARTGIPLGVLPLGTYNLLAQDLGIPTRLDEAVACLARGLSIQIDLGTTGGHYFHTLAGLGFFARTARERASIRKQLPGARALGALIAALRSLAFQGQLDVEIDDGRGRHFRVRTPALLVTNNELDHDNWRRPSLSAGVLELHVADGAMPFPLLQGGFAAIRGTWRQHPGVQTLTSPHLELRFRRPRVFMSLDGETSRRSTPLTLEVVPGALTCLVGSGGRT